MVESSPMSIGNNTLRGYDGQGYSVNPVTGVPYAENNVNVGDFTRAFNEFWLEEFDTPCVHMNQLFNAVSDHLDEKRFGGQGRVIGELGV